MNFLHRWFCSSSSWKQTVEKFIVPWVLDGIDLGSQSLEIGPGYGATTDVLCTRAEHLTCVEIDERLAEGLRRRQQKQNVRVVCQDATMMDFAAETFDSAVCFTMLHHVPSACLQNHLLKQVARVLRPEAFSRAPTASIASGSVLCISSTLLLLFRQLLSVVVSALLASPM